MAGWASAAVLLLIPLVAMQFTDEVKWDVFDFAAFGSMLLGAGVLCELAVRMTFNAAYRFAVGIAVAAAFLLIWVNLAVGIIGSEDNPANLMYAAVLAIAAVGAVIGRFQPAGMARALSAAALAQALVGIIALAAGSVLRTRIFRKLSCSRPVFLERCGSCRPICSGGPHMIVPRQALQARLTARRFRKPAASLEDSESALARTPSEDTRVSLANARRKFAAALSSANVVSHMARSIRRSPSEISPRRSAACFRCGD